MIGRMRGVAWHSWHPDNTYTVFVQLKPAVAQGIVPERLAREWERWFGQLSPGEPALQHLETHTFV